MSVWPKGLNPPLIHRQQFPKFPFHTEANKEVSAEQLDSMIAKGNVEQALLSDVVKEQQLKDLKERTDNLRGILDNIQEMVELQNTLSLLIDSAGPVLDNLEAIFADVEQNVEEGDKNLKKARFYQQSRYKIICIGILVVLIIIGIIVGVIVAKKSSGSSGAANQS